MKSLQELLEMKVKGEDKDGNPIEFSPDFRIAVQEHIPGSGPRIIIHPASHNGDTLDLIVMKNAVLQAFPEPVDEEEAKSRRDLAWMCGCGSVHFNLLNSSEMECADCGQRFGMWADYDREFLYAALREIVNRIEKCGASPELTNAVSLASDLASAVGNKFNMNDHYAGERVAAELDS